MRLKELLKDVNVLTCQRELLDEEIKDVKIDSRQVEYGDIFIALKGENFDGNNFIDHALENGAKIIISEKDLPVQNCVKVDNSRVAYALISKHFFYDACDDLRIIAITGTNGKTTTTNTIASLLQTAGANVGVIGTLGARFNNKTVDTGFTTPDPYLLHSIFKQMKDASVEFVVMEASAHALALNKLDGIIFEIGVLTNITEDHLDFFGDMETYANAKFKLFEEGRVKLGIVAGGKEYCDRLLDDAFVPIISYGVGDYDIKGECIKMSFDESKFICDYMGEKIPIQTSLVGGYNIENALASIAVARSLGVDKNLIQLGMNRLSPVEGRFNVIKMKGQNIIIDFAHTPDGLEKVLSTARELSKNKLVVVFGCGGNRDKKKRPIMGEIASSLADEVVLTSDNPRYEEPMEIINEIKTGIKGNAVVEPNRKKAIEYALKKFCKGETIVIAGKGGEKYQEIKGVKYPYNDFDAVYNFYRQNIRQVNIVLEDQEKEV